jgi:sigma-B regulation protein RsbU (phosphoserine phosphatase)
MNRESVNPDSGPDLQCTEVWGGSGASDVSISLAGVRGEVWAQPFDGDVAGGDIHFLSVCGITKLSKVVLADVSGHGAATARISRVIHEALSENIGAPSNTAMLEQVNTAFLERREGEFRFTTMVSMIFDNRDRSLVYAYAGHPSILRGRGGKFSRLVPQDGPRGGIPLGVFEGGGYEQHSAQLEQGDVLAVYTDAFTEARGSNGEMLQEAGLASLLEEAESMKPSELKHHLLARLSGTFDDDASLVILEVL